MGSEMCIRDSILAPPEELLSPELPGVNPGGQPQESGGDSGKRTNTYKKPEGLTYISSEPLMPTTEGLIYTIIQNHYRIQIARTTITYNRRTNIHKKVVQNHYYLQPEGLTPTRKKHHMYRTTIVYK